MKLYWETLADDYHHQAAMSFHKLAHIIIIIISPPEHVNNKEQEELCSAFFDESVSDWLSSQQAHLSSPAATM